MDKLKMNSVNKVNENIEKIGKLFPNCLTERIDKNGRAELAIDFDMLKQELCDTIVEGSEERYQFTWPDKKKSVMLSNAPIAKTLRPCKEESVNFDTTENLYIEGDNLDVLKILQETYLNKIKMIYIDPPYNTGNDFIYKDDFSQNAQDYLQNSGQFDEDGNRLFKNMETNGRFHTDWLNMIYPRLKLAKDLLRGDGVIFISINDNEQANLKKICDEIFGESNFVANLFIELSTTQGMKVAAAQKGEIVKNGEFIYIYAKNKVNFSTNILYVAKEWDDHYSIYIDKKTNKRYTLIEILKNKYPNISKKEMERLYNFDDNFRNYIHEIADNIYRDAMLDSNLELTINQEKELNNGNIVKYRNYLIFKTSSQVIRQLLPLSRAIGITNDFEEKFGLRKIRGNWWKDFYKDMMNINKEGDIVFKNGKKPARLIKDLIKISTNPNDIILDFFSGSATTAHAVMQLNAENLKNEVNLAQNNKANSHFSSTPPPPPILRL